MKKTRLLIILVLIIGCLSVLSACNKLPTMQSPTNVKVNLTDLTLTWSAVRDAKLYTVSIQPTDGEAKEFLVSKATYSLSFLEPGDYTIKVKVNGRDEESKDSEWTEAISFTREQEPGLVLKLSKDGSSYEVTEKGIATGHIVIPDTYRGKPVTSIGKKAFFNKSDVTGVTFGKNITSIGEFAFANCSYLEQVVLPEGLTDLGRNAFASCRLLAGELVIPDTLEVIPENAFAYCAQLTDIDFGSGVHSIGPTAFTDCTGLTSLQLPDNVRYIYDNAFIACTNLTDVNLGNGLEAIGPYAFAGLENLQTIYIPDSVKTLGEGAFSTCTKLKNITLGSGIEMIDVGAFYGTGIWENPADNEVYAGKWFLGLKDDTATALNLREDTVGIANYALAGNEVLEQINLPDSVKIIGNMAFAEANFSSITLGGGVEIIGDQAFYGCKKLVTAILRAYDFIEHEPLDSSLKTIGSYAFRNCEALEEIEIPETVTTIGTQVFLDSGIWKKAEEGLVYAGNWLVGFTDQFEGVANVKEGTVGVANYAFYQCAKLTTIKLPNSLKHLGRAAFYKCTQLTSVTLPNTLEVIEEYTFYHCDRLQLFTLPPVLRSIGRSAFYKCGSVNPQAEDGSVLPDGTSDTLTIPSGVEFIGDYAFYGCGQATTDANMDPLNVGIDILIISDGVKQIGANAFYGFVSLREVVLGNSLESIGEKAFQKCTALEKITFGTGLQTISDKAFYKCTALKELVLPDNITHIGEYAFYACGDLRKVDLGDGLTHIGKLAFYGCTNLGDLRLSSSLVEIGKQAFRNCYSLRSVALHKDIQTIQPHAFYGCNELTLYVESAAAGENWDRFWNSSYRPVIWECTLSEGKDYVVSFNKSATSIDNKNATNTLSLPTRAGYTCIGWNTNAAATEAAYTIDTIMEVTDGRKLYAIWVED